MSVLLQYPSVFKRYQQLIGLVKQLIELIKQLISADRTSQTIDRVSPANDQISDKILYLFDYHWPKHATGKYIFFGYLDHSLHLPAFQSII